MSSTEVKSWTVNELIDALDSKPKKKEKIIIPQYQRNVVWNKEQKKKLIDSMKDGMPIGALLLYYDNADKGYNIYHLVDGLQRSTSLKAYQEEPTKFFNKDNVSDDLLVFLLNYFNSDKETLNKYFVEWIQLKKGFSEVEKYSSSDLAYFLDEKTGGLLDKNQIKELTEKLPIYLDKINKESNISEKSIPIIIYYGNKANLPLIFERINSEGTHLNKYQIYAATWSTYNPIQINNIEIVNRIKDKYEALIEEGLEVENYDSTNFYLSKFNYFEYFFGMGKLLTDKYPVLFGKPDKKDRTESIGFNLGAICLNHDLKKMEKLPELMVNIDIDKYEKSIFDAVNFVYDVIKPFINFKANRATGGTLSTTFHTEMQIVSMIGKVYHEKYDDSFNVKADWKTKKKLLEKNLPYHYLYDILRSYWSGSGDLKALELVNSNRYENEIKEANWENVFSDWFDTEINKSERSRVNIKPYAILFLNYIYTHLFSAHQHLSSIVYEIEHICPLTRLKEVATKLPSNDGLPMSCISNLCLLEKTINGNKLSKTYYEYFDDKEKSGKLTSIEADAEIKNIEERTFINRQELAFITQFDINNKDDYYDFLKMRFSRLKNQFYTLNNVNQ